MNSTINNLSMDSPFSSRFLAWMKERFPLISHGILIVSYYSSNQFLAEVLTRPDERLLYTLGSLLGAITLLCIFFHLRVFDEHKDFQEDCRHYPDRVLQRGLISLKHLKIAGVIAIILELACAACWMPTGKPAALVAVLVTLGFSLLMLKEFFVARWLKEHFLIYAMSHMMIMPLIAMVVFSFTTGEYFWNAPGWFWLYAFVGFFVTLNWEISRKIRSPDQEIEGVDSYTQIFGVRGAAHAVLVVRVIDTVLVAVVGWHLNASGWFYVALIGLFCVCLTGYFKYLKDNNAKNAKRMETYAGMYIIAFDLILAFELIRSHGVAFQWWH